MRIDSIYPLFSHRHKKKAQKHTPKKADHKHEYQPVILHGYNRVGILDKARGFVPRLEYIAGQRCIHCGKLDYGFPDSPTCIPVSWDLEVPWVSGGTKKVNILLDEYRFLPLVEVNNLWDLKEEKRNG